jgi:PhnB protein
MFCAFFNENQTNFFTKQNFSNMGNTNKDSKLASVHPVPEGFHTVTPYLIANHAEMLIDFVKEAFDAKVTFVSKSDDGRIIHATVKIGDSVIMVSDTMEGMPPEPAMLYLYVEDIDTVYKQALMAKGISVREPKNEFYGDRCACIKDAWDNKWWIATHVEDVDNEELKRRAKEAEAKEREKNTIEA